jgi:hypothetical protein
MSRDRSRTVLELRAGELIRAIANLETFFSRYFDDNLPAGPAAPDPLRGLYLTPADVGTLLRPPRFIADPETQDGLLDDLTGFVVRVQAEGLDRFDAAALLLAAGPDLDLRFERVYGYANDDLTRRWPTADLLLNLLCRSIEEKAANRHRFASHSRLLESGLLQAIVDPAQVEPPVLGRLLKADEHVVSWLTADQALHSKLMPCAELSSPSGPFGPSLDAAVARIWDGMPRWSVGPNVHTAEAAACVVAARLGRPLLHVQAPPIGAAAYVPYIFRQARLNDAVVFLDGLDRIDAERDRQSLVAALTSHEGAVIVPSSAEWLAGHLVFADLQIQGPGLSGRTPRATSPLVRQVRPVAGWEDLILPESAAAQLREICDQAKHRDIVMSRWGFENKVRGGGQLSALFSGASGTGKTMAAEVLSHELGRELHRIDLSQIMSKYIGETEKNLGAVFAAAEAAGAMLFFDEADALFGKRSAVKDAHDRYANVEISYLLQRMEEYRGVAILATNLRHNMDPAFVRRLRFSVEFPFPDEAIRHRIWAIQFPPAAPLADDLDLAPLACRFPLSGGSIRNVALNAAYFAASASEPIATTHLVRAIRREYQKMGRPCTEDEFGPYFIHLREASA